MSLWYGTSDAVAPSETVQAGTEATITVGVSADPGNRGEVHYRVNHGKTEVVPANWVRNESSKNAQYFRARLPAFRAGDTVEYVPTCRCGGRQLPSAEEASRFPSSFRVTGTQPEPERALRLVEAPSPRPGARVPSYRGTASPREAAMARAPDSPQPPPATPASVRRRARDGGGDHEGPSIAIEITSPVDGETLT